MLSFFFQHKDWNCGYMIWFKLFIIKLFFISWIWHFFPKAGCSVAKPQSKTSKYMYNHTGNFNVCTFILFTSIFIILVTALQKKEVEHTNMCLHCTVLCCWWSWVKKVCVPPNTSEFYTFFRLEIQANPGKRVGRM